MMGMGVGVVGAGAQPVRKSPRLVRKAQSILPTPTHKLHAAALPTYMDPLPSPPSLPNPQNLLGLEGTGVAQLCRYGVDCSDPNCTYEYKHPSSSPSF